MAPSHSFHSGAVTTSFTPMTSEMLLKQSLLEFFKPAHRFKTFYDVVNKKTDYSLRVLEWFVTKYAEKYDVSYVIPLPGGKRKEINIATDYHNQMSSYQKKCFDPFRRHDKFLISNGQGLTFVTTVCQMNFFKWAIENKVLDYVQTHLSEIKADMSRNGGSGGNGAGVRETSRTPSPGPSSSSRMGWFGTPSSTKHRRGNHHHHGRSNNSSSGSSSKGNGNRKASVNASAHHFSTGPNIIPARTCVKRFKSVVLEFD